MSKRLKLDILVVEKDYWWWKRTIPCVEGLLVVEKDYWWWTKTIVVVENGKYGKSKILENGKYGPQACRRRFFFLEKLHIFEKSHFFEK